MRSRPTVSVIICTRHRPALLRQSLACLRSLNPAADEIIVVDNTAGEPACRALADEFGVRYLFEPVEGLSRARNRGMAAATCEIVAFLDDDSLPLEDWLRRLAEPFAASDVAIVTGDIYVQSADVPAPADLAPTRSLCNRDPEWFEMATYGGLGTGSNMALRKALIAGWQGFDARLGRGTPLRIAEESHAFALLLDRGLRAVHVPAAIVLHPSGPRDVLQEATCSFAYWLLLFFEFPAHRGDLVRFLTRRLRRKRLAWPRNPQGPGEVILSGWRVYVQAGINGALLYLRNRRPKPWLL
ncbi:MAG TPA: glycosyltransferase family 2 protein [Terracidiphilus sp.]|nr:glycosyltransferase family 2 protein [Terracidiphilus sp.]